MVNDVVKKTLENFMNSRGFSFIKELKNDSDVYIALFENDDKEAIPDKLAAGINKHTGKTAYSIMSIADIEAKIK